MRLDFCNISIHLSRSKLLSAANRSLPFNETKNTPSNKSSSFCIKIKINSTEQIGINKIDRGKIPEKMRNMTEKEIIWINLQWKRIQVKTLIDIFDKFSIIHKLTKQIVRKLKVQQIRKDNFCSSEYGIWNSAWKAKTSVCKAKYKQFGPV